VTCGLKLTVTSLGGTARGHRKSPGRRLHFKAWAAASRDRSDLERGIPRIAYNKRSLFLRFSYDYSAKVQGSRVHVDLRHRRGAYPLHLDSAGGFIRVITVDGKCPGLRPGEGWRKAHFHGLWFDARGYLKRDVLWNCTEARVVATDAADIERGAAGVFHLQIFLCRLPDGDIAKVKGSRVHVDVSPP
jgi:hypothetical protein